MNLGKIDLGRLDRASTISALGHLGVILWAVMGDWLFSPKDMPPMDVAQVSLVSEGEFQAMMASAPKPDPAATPSEDPPKIATPEPVDTSLPAPEPAPQPEEPVAVEEILPETVPVSPDVQPVAVPEPAPQVAEEDQPIPVPESSKKPKPRPAQRITDVPVDSPADTPEVADTVTPEVSDQAAPDAQVVETTEPAAAPEESAAMVSPDATKSDAPELAPTASRRPQSRPARQVQADKPAETTSQSTETADAAADAIAAALAEAATSDAASASAQNLPEGPPMSAGEKDGVRSAINACWNIGSLSSAAQRVKLVMRLEMNEDGTPIGSSIQMTGFEGGDEAAAQQAFEAAKRAVVRGVKGCGGKSGYQLDPAKYGQWNVMNLTFDASGMRLR